MSPLSNSLVAAVVASAVVASVPAYAFSVTFGGAKATQIDVDTNLLVEAGKTTAVAGYVDAATNTVLNPNVFLETFDPVRYKMVPDVGLVADPTGTLNQFGFPYRPTTGPTVGEIEFSGSGGGFATLNPNDRLLNGGDLTLNQGGNGSGATMGIRKGTVGYAAAPGGVANCNAVGAACNQTYYAYGPGQNGAMRASVRVDYTNLLGEYGPGYQIDYLGIFYGSIDSYNGINFYNTAGQKISGTGALVDGTLTGDEILAAMSGSSGNQSSPNSNVYLNLSFLSNEQFSSFELYTDGVAIEVDNIVTHIGQVPEPASLALLGLGLFGLAGMRRKAKA